MARCSKRFRQALQTAIPLVAFSPAAFAQLRTGDLVAHTKKLLTQLYPDLRRDLRAVIKESPTVIWTSILSNDLELDLYDNRYGGGAIRPDSLVLAVESVLVDEPNGIQLVRWGASGPFVSEKRERFVEEVSKHEDWSDAQIVAALERAGARFSSPDKQAELLRVMPTSVLKTYLGGEIEVVRAFLDIGINATSAWLVRVKVHSTNGQEYNYLLSFEPFEGRLEMVVRR